MTVAELIDKLLQMPPGLPVVRGDSEWGAFDIVEVKVDNDASIMSRDSMANERRHEMVVFVE